MADGVAQCRLLLAAVFLAVQRHQRGRHRQQNSELQQKGFAKVNLTAALTTGRFTIKAFATNLLNAKTYAYGLDLRGAGFPTTSSCPPPRVPLAALSGWHSDMATITPLT